jgi:hypothetical protein
MQQASARATTPALRAILERRLDFTRRCERTQGRIIPWVFPARLLREGDIAEVGPEVVAAARAFVVGG